MNSFHTSRGLRAPGLSGLICSFLALVIVSALISCGSPEPPAGGEVDAVTELWITTQDGVRLKASRHTPDASPIDSEKPPGLVLVHSLGTDRTAWNHFAEKARKAGFMVLAFDMRGHGESTARNGEKIAYREFDTQDWLGVLQDIDAAKAALFDGGANPSDFAIVGASIGANLALHYAVDHPDVPAIVMISPGLDYKGVGARDEIVALGQRPVLLMTSTGDAYSASSCTTLKAAASGHCELREYAGTAHGIDLLDMSPQALDQVLLWLEPIVGPKG